MNRCDIDYLWQANTALKNKRRNGFGIPISTYLKFTGQKYKAASLANKKLGM